MSFLECFQSLFQWNNETLNVWTHCFTLFFFIWKFSTLEVDFLFDSRYWPLLAFAIGAWMYPTLSCLAHTFSSMAVPVRHICFFCDYAGISVYSIGSSVAYYAYSIPDHVKDSFLGMLYRPINVTMAIFCCYVCCVSRDKKWQSIQSTLRALSFAVPYVFTSSFVVYGILISFYSHSLWFHYSQFFWCILMAVTMTTKIPEKYITEYFDVVGHSHQWFHIFVFIATNNQINAVILDMTELGKNNGIREWSFSGSVGLVLMVILANTLIVCFFSYRIITLNSEPVNCKKDKSL